MSTAFLSGEEKIGAVQTTPIFSDLAVMITVYYSTLTL